MILEIGKFDPKHGTYVGTGEKDNCSFSGCTDGFGCEIWVNASGKEYYLVGLYAKEKYFVDA
jgi:hypothetical protein